MSKIQETEKQKMNGKRHKKQAPPQFSLFESPVDELTEAAADEIKDQYYTQKVTPSPTRINVFLLLETLKKMPLHALWLDSGPEYFLCEENCQLCLAGEKSHPFLVGRIYQPDEDQGATLLLPLHDTSKTKVIGAVKTLKAIYDEVGAENMVRVPLELSMDTARTGVRHSVIEADKDAAGKYFIHKDQDPEYVAAQSLRENLPDEPLLRPFSVDRDGTLMPKIAKRIRRKLGVQN